MSIVLTYFDFDGSRGLECRLALVAAGVTFEDRRVTGEAWKKLKPTLPFGSLPVLENEGRSLAQSNAILRFVGRSHGLHPKDPWIAAEHDAILQSVEDLREKMPSQAGWTDDEKRTAREAFSAGWLSTWATFIDARIHGPFLEGEELQIVDIKLYVILRSFVTGVYDHLPASVFSAHPRLLALHQAVDRHPAIQAYFGVAP